MNTEDAEPATERVARPVETPEPGERPPRLVPGARRQLDHAPSDRFRRPGEGSAGKAYAEAAAGLQRRAIIRAVGLAGVAAGIGAALLILILGVLASTAGTFAVSGLASAAIGLLVATAAVPQARTPDPGGASGTAGAPLRRDQATRLAMGIAAAMIVATGIGVWLFGRLEGGVMDPVTYLWTTFGFGLPAQAVIALVGAAWGAANGPLRRGS